MSTSKDNPILAKLDAMSRLTRIPQLVEKPPRRRHLRWLPIAALLLATAALLVILLTPRHFGTGYGCLILGMSLANFMPLFGPLKQGQLLGDDPDERELALKRDAQRIGYAAVSAAAFLGIFAIAGLDALFDWPRHTMIWALLSLNLYLVTLLGVVPTLYASWAVPAPDFIED